MQLLELEKAEAATETTLKETIAEIQNSQMRAAANARLSEQLQRDINEATHSLLVNPKP